MSATFLEPCKCGHPRGDHWNTQEGTGVSACQHDCGCLVFRLADTAPAPETTGGGE